MIKEQVVTEDYAIYNSDCMYVLPTLPNDSVDLSVYSPPFAGLYNYSSHENDFSNCESREQFLQQYEYLVQEISRVTKPVESLQCIVRMFSITDAFYGTSLTKLLEYMRNTIYIIVIVLQFGKSL